LEVRSCFSLDSSLLHPQITAIDAMDGSFLLEGRSGALIDQLILKRQPFFYKRRGPTLDAAFW
jgi:hypothetical protein